MRIEMHAFLWVTGLLFVAGVLSYGPAVPRYLPYDGVLGTLGDLPAAEQAIVPVAGQFETVSAARPTSIFPSKVDPVLPVSAAQEMPPVRVLLKGVVDVGGSRKGVLATDGGQYAVVGAGDTFGSVEILAVSADAVVISKSDGSEEKLLLRGAGELP